MKDRKEMFSDLCEMIYDTYCKKNNDYGNSCVKTYEKFGHVAFATRMNDKLNRYEALCVENKKTLVKNEKAFDTLLDLASYAIQAAVEIMVEGSEV